MMNIIKLGSSNNQKADPISLITRNLSTESEI